MEPSSIYATRYNSETGLRLRDLVTGDDRWLKYPVQHDDQESYFSSRDLLPQFTFLPDGKEIVLSYGGKLHRLNIENKEDRLIPFTATISRELGPRLYFPARVDESHVHARLIQGAVASPDGRELALSSLTHLYIASLNGGPPRRVTLGRWPRISACLVARWKMARLRHLVKRRRSDLEDTIRRNWHSSAPHIGSGLLHLSCLVARFVADRCIARFTLSGDDANR